MLCSVTFYRCEYDVVREGALFPRSGFNNLPELLCRSRIQATTFEGTEWKIVMVWREQFPHEAQPTSEVWARIREDD